MKYISFDMVVYYYLLYKIFFNDYFFRGEIEQRSANPLPKNKVILITNNVHISSYISYVQWFKYMCVMYNHVLVF